MAEFLSDQDILDLIGDLGNYAGLPGGVANGQYQPLLGPETASAQHPLYPLQFIMATHNASGTITVGGPGQRCILPSADGNSNLCMSITQQGPFPIKPNAWPVPRYDVVIGQATLNSMAPSGLASLGATFHYITGPNQSSAPPAYAAGFAPVILVTVPPSGVPLHAGTAQVVLPSLTFVSLPGSGSFASAQLSGVVGAAAPLTAAVVTAPPFNAPFIPGSAQGTIQPTLDAMPAIQAALNAVGPGGAIYIPSGTYGYKSTVTTMSGPLSDPFGNSV